MHIFHPYDVTIGKYALIEVKSRVNCDKNLIAGGNYQEVFIFLIAIRTVLIVLILLNALILLTPFCSKCTHETSLLEELEELEHLERFLEELEELERSSVPGLKPSTHRVLNVLRFLERKSIR